ncbi:hypothetical protein ACHAWF_011721 [Thalassiosira exigua]
MADRSPLDDGLLQSESLLSPPPGGGGDDRAEALASRAPPMAIWSERVHGGPLLAPSPPSEAAHLPHPDVEDYGFSDEEKKDGGGGLLPADDDGDYFSPLHPPASDGAAAPRGEGSRGGSGVRPDGGGGDKPSSSVLLGHFGLRHSVPSTLLLMKRLGKVLLATSSATFLLVVFPLFVRQAVRDARKGRADFAAFYSAAGFVVLTLVLSFREILQHLYNWYAPDVQKFVVRILFMVPLYSVQSWMGLRFHGPARAYIDAVRDLYEAYVLQSFVYYLVELMGGEDRMAELLGRKEARLGGHGRWISKVMPRWEMGKPFLLQIKRGVLQYVVVKTFFTLLTTFVLLPSGNWGEGSFSPDSAYLYVAFVLNLSVMYALYCLVKLFHAVKSDLRSPVNWHPVGKFLCVKGVVFFTWWQGVGIYFLRSHGIIGDVGTWPGDDVAGGIIDYLICVEMVFFAIAHMFTFTYKEYLPEGMEDQRKSGIVGWLFEGVDKRRRRNRAAGGRHRSTSDLLSGEDGSPALQSALLEDEEEVTPCVGEDGGIDESSYRPSAPPTTSSSGFSKLEDPLSLREALWSSTVPRETLDDIKRLGVQGSFGRMGGGRGGGGLLDGGTDIGLTSMNNAERI